MKRLKSIKYVTGNPKNIYQKWKLNNALFISLILPYKFYQNL